MNEHTDTRVTDYALGELPEADRLQLEAQLKDDAELRGAVEETRRLAGLLQAANSAAAPISGSIAEPEVAASSELRSLVQSHLAAASTAAAATTTPASSERRKWNIAVAGLSAALAVSAAFVLVNSATWKAISPGTDELARVQSSSAPAPTATSGGPGASWELSNTRNYATSTGGDASFRASRMRQLNDSDINPDSGGGSNANRPLVLKGNNTYTGVTSSDDMIRQKVDSQVAPAPVAGPVIHSPTPARPVEMSVTRGGVNVAAQPLQSPIPQVNTFDYTPDGATDSRKSEWDRVGLPAQSPNTPPMEGTPVSKELFPLLLAHQEQLAKYGPKHPEVLETELRIKAVTDQQQAAQGKQLPRLLIRNRSDVTAVDSVNGRWDVDNDGDGKADTLWVDLGRPAQPAELADLQKLTDELAANVRPETWREAKSAEELERRLSENQGYFDFEARVDSIRRGDRPMNTDAYDSVPENPFYRTTDAPLSTFSIDVDTASYSNVRRYLTSGQLPPPAAVRLEEFVNYFTYDYPQPTGDDPFSVTTEAARCPWNGDHVLVRVGLKGREVHRKERPASNLVFLVDVSGSMQQENKLPLVRESLKLLTRELGDSDRVAIVVYAGSTGLVLPPTGGDRKQTILEAIDRLEAGGSTNGGAGIELAYQLATDHFIPKGINRVILATDGDFNVGITDQGSLVRLIEEKAKSKVFFSALGYGMGNLKDSTLEKLSDKGNGNYAYIDTIKEAQKVLVEQMSGTLMTIAKDVKIQIEFNPATVAGYRLLGYENRVLAAQDFNDDKKDAGEIGAGHTVTALYELIPSGKAGKKETKKLPEVDELKYQAPAEPAPQAKELAGELLTLKLRYKQPEGDVSKLLEQPLKNDVTSYAKASPDFKFASSVAGFGMLLRHSKYHGSATFDAVLELAQEGIGHDEGGYRKEFVELVRKAKEMSRK